MSFLWQSSLVCMWRGYHRRSGVGTTTSSTLWADHCADCGVLLEEVA